MGAEHASVAPPNGERRLRRYRQFAVPCAWPRAMPNPRRRFSPCLATAPWASISRNSRRPSDAACPSSPWSETTRCWNAESQIQLRSYGPNRMHNLDLLPARYDLVVAALGGHGEFVDKAADLPAAIDRAIASGKPALINIMTESMAAPTIRLKV